ncbi:hypothetical protein [Pseudoxanthomonas mexicana]|uniref:hypothetical protein n=1 Tax=Pseudoxanthomonas mexicana TaxID=128785 RepID=UPI00398B484A
MKSSASAAGPFALPLDVPVLSRQLNPCGKILVLRPITIIPVLRCRVLDRRSRKNRVAPILQSLDRLSGTPARKACAVNESGQPITAPRLAIAPAPARFHLLTALSMPTCPMGAALGLEKACVYA